MKRIIAVIVIVLLLILLPVLFLAQVWSKMFVSTADTSVADNLPKSAMLDSYFTNKKPFNILLLGYGGGTHEGAYLTDSIMDVSINPATKKITLISIPRDIWLAFPDTFNIGDHWKVNASYAIGLNNKDFPNKPAAYQGEAGGINLTKFAVSEITGQPVDRVVLVDFAGFEKGVDLLGGIDVTIDKTFDDYQYPIDGKEDDPCGKTKEELESLQGEELANPELIFPCRYEHLHFDKGVAHLDGASALKLARSRHSSEDGTDFARSARQRNILVAIKKKVFSPSFLPKTISMLSLLGDHVRTDISFSELGTLIAHNKELEEYSIQDLALTNDNYLQDSSDPNAGYTLIPKDGVDQWDTIHTWIAIQLQEK